ncbi:septal ring lytic transglycosylase RlpA family protein [Vibrio sp. SM6]|uniref:Endolytic peptidoglycan transglycosylase RlpA n=1 Tax=Vibrio agarilyticus TaxID=2726741 RepID=A0A7X8TSP4_9VIBR|nr:septal ring lytic transglycosylase RlpA family protein [Vibrio agarilyticus]NLS14172.1 septal ring lytic transglycosylase RlpA family protein [Vibrio agarilyticus]
MTRSFRFSALALISVSVFTLQLTGCSSPSQERYELTDDTPPSAPIPVEHIEDAQPRYEPYSLGGNKDYTLRGERYEIITQPKGFTQTGIASWYGEKFQGHLTSNGEIYDMYSMTAAHKTLPLPSYVKVRNLDNDKTALVRVNDRGPFHPERIIDLSYAAAKKLGVLQSGTARVAIEVITVEKPTSAEALKRLPQYVIQTASSPHKERLAALGTELASALQVTSFVESQNDQHRLMLGPFDDQSLTKEVLLRLSGLGYTGAFIKSHSNAR